MQNVIGKLLSSIGRKKLWILAYTIAIIIRILLAIPLVHDWDGFVFSESAKNMLKGITPYKTVEQNSIAIYPDSDRPTTEQWLGYPPLPLLMFTTPYAIASISGLLTSSIVENFVLKIPFIFGDILCAYLAMRFLKNRGQKLANRAALLILFNPLLIWVSSAWGMFDIWIVNFILLFLLAIRSKKVVFAGIFLACAPLVKLFPVFFLPAVLLYANQNIPDAKKKILFLISFILTVLVIVVPFFLSSPQGFLNQNLIMHWYRPPQGIGIIAMLDFISHIYRFNISHIITIASIFTLITIFFFNLLSLVYVKGQESRLLTIILLVYTSILAFNKVVNEQYYVVLVGFLIVITHLSKEEITLFSKRFLEIIEAVVTLSVLFTGVVLGFHFLTFLPPFISINYLNTSTNYLVFYLSKLVPQLPLYTYPNSLWTYYNAPVAITYIVLIPTIIICFYIVLKGYFQIFHLRIEIIKTLRDCWVIPKFSLFRAFLVLSIATSGFILITPLPAYLVSHNAFNLIDLIETTYEQPVSNFPINPRVGTFYNVWWNNPSHQKDLADDSWSKTTLTPEVGYYTSKNSLYARHIQQMKEVGIDYAAVSYHLYDRERYLTFSKYAEKMGIYYAPMIEFVDILGHEEYRAVSPSGDRLLGSSIKENSRKALANVTISSLIDNLESPALLRINNKPVVFAFFGHWFLPGWDLESKRLLAQRVIDRYSQNTDTPFVSISKAWNVNVGSIDDVMKFYPKDIQNFNQNNQIAMDYKNAFLVEYEVFWNQLRDEIEGKVGKIYLISTYPPRDPSSVLDPSSQKEAVIQFDDFASLNVFDSEFFYGISSTWYSWRYFTDKPDVLKKRWEEQVEIQARRQIEKKKPTILTVMPTYNESLVRPYNPFEPIAPEINGIKTYDWTWETALKNKPDYILITSWNEFFEGSAIEPTKEYGSYYLNATKQWITKYKALTPANIKQKPR